MEMPDRFNGVNMKEFRPQASSYSQLAQWAEEFRSKIEAEEDQFAFMELCSLAQKVDEYRKKVTEFSEEMRKDNLARGIAEENVRFYRSVIQALVRKYDYYDE